MLVPSYNNFSIILKFLEPLYDYKKLHIQVYSITGSEDIDMDGDNILDYEDDWIGIDYPESEDADQDGILDTMDNWVDVDGDGIDDIDGMTIQDFCIQYPNDPECSQSGNPTPE